MNDKDASSAAMHHLGNVLTILAELHEDDRSRAYDEALAFYNAHNPDAQVAPVEGYSTRLTQIGPLDTALARAAGGPDFKG